MADEQSSRIKGVPSGMLATAIEIVSATRQMIEQACGGDATLRFALRRYVTKRLEFDERGRPADRRKVKLTKVIEQRGLCAICQKQLPTRGSELDRFDALKGYTADNVRVLCHSCHRSAQEERNFS